MLGSRITRILDADGLPTLPAVAIEAVRLMEGESSSFQSIAQLIKNDQVLAGRILHYANSAYAGMGRQVSSISQAISLLGFNTVRSIILSVSVFDCFTSQFAQQKLSLVNFWLHSIGVAVTAEKLAQRLAFPSPEEAYMAGLIHDLGKLVCYKQFPEKFQEVCRELEQRGAFSTRPTSHLDIEKAILDTDHTEVGRLIAERWNLPEVLGRTMWLHHQPVWEPISPNEGTLHQLIRFADLLCNCHNVGSSYFLVSDTYCPHHFHLALEHIVANHHLTQKEIETMMTEVVDRIKTVGNTLGFSDEQVYRKMVATANLSLGTMSMDLEKNNRQLSEANQVLGAVNEMIRSLHPGISLGEAAEIVLDAARKGFGVNRGLCMIRNNAAGIFVGRLFEHGSFHEFILPLSVNEIKKRIFSRNVSDLEVEAIQHLERNSIDCAQEGQTFESGAVNIVAGSQFLATFFVNDSLVQGEKTPVLGQLLLDFAGVSDLPQTGVKGMTKNFETLAMAAGSGINRILMNIDMRQMAQNMMETTRKMEENQHQLFQSHRLATVGSLAAGASHEINNPLTIISLNIQMLDRLLRQQTDTTVARGRLKIVSEQVERISKIIQDLMSFARPVQPKFQPSSLLEIVGKVLSVLKDRISMTNIHIENRMRNDLPLLWVDPLQIEQVALNLLINARQAMSEGGTITLAASASEEFVELQVTDTGTGISRENIGKIFDPFFTTKKENEGTGLGLAICHSIIEHNGGLMRVKSSSGVGTTFFVSLPVDKGVRLRAMKQDINDKAASVTSVPQEKCRILVVDDERILNDMLRENLNGAGYLADGAFDGVEAIGLLRYKEYHLILLDLRMPRKDGIEVLKFVKEEFSDIPVVIITGLASREEIEETIRLGAFACLKKPFRFEDVLNTINRALMAEGRVKKCKPPDS